jgi:hypothetical protein
MTLEDAAQRRGADRGGRGEPAPFPGAHRAGGRDLDRQRWQGSGRMQNRQARFAPAAPEQPQESADSAGVKASPPGHLLQPEEAGEVQLGPQANRGGGGAHTHRRPADSWVGCPGHWAGQQRHRRLAVERVHLGSLTSPRQVGGQRRRAKKGALTLEQNTHREHGPERRSPFGILAPPNGVSECSRPSADPPA